MPELKVSKILARYLLKKNQFPFSDLFLNKIKKKINMLQKVSIRQSLWGGGD